MRLGLFWGVACSFSGAVLRLRYRFSFLFNGFDVRQDRVNAFVKDLGRLGESGPADR